MSFFFPLYSCIYISEQDAFEALFKELQVGPKETRLITLNEALNELKVTITE